MLPILISMIWIYEEYSIIWWERIFWIYVSMVLIWISKIQMYEDLFDYIIKSKIWNIHYHGFHLNIYMIQIYEDVFDYIMGTNILNICYYGSHIDIYDPNAWRRIRLDNENEYSKYTLPYFSNLYLWSRYIKTYSII